MKLRTARHLVSRSVVLFGLFVAFCSTDCSAITIPTVPVGNSGNAADTTGYGAVGYEYRIGTTEVTNAHYTEFLNFKAASNSLALYNTNMASGPQGGITRSGVDGSYTYTTKPNMADKPVNFVSWYDAIRFANWLHNGQGSGDTETGAYTILGGTSTPSNGLSITRNVGAMWFLTSEDEWYKAAYHQPTTLGGDTDAYWLYATGSNNAPTVATANSVGDVSNPGPNVANYNMGADWNNQNGNVTTVGSAGPLSDSFYGTSDQAGNVYEWNEALISSSLRGIRGSAYLNNVVFLQSSNRASLDPTFELPGFGFRMATIPEPGTAVLGLLALISLLWLKGPGW